MSIKLTLKNNRINIAAIKIHKNAFSTQKTFINTTEISNKKLNQIKSLNIILSKRFSINLSKDYYQILNISPDASEKEIKNAYLALVKRYHPDVTGGKSTEHFKEISNSYKILSDKSSKSFYDSNSEKVSRYYYSSTAFESSSSKKPKNANIYTEFYDEPNNQSRSEFNSKYYSREHYRNGNYYQNPHSSYYQDQKGNGFSRRFGNNTQLAELVNDYMMFLPKIIMFILLYLFCYLMTCNTKNEYHLFI